MVQAYFYYTKQEGRYIRYIESPRPKRNQTWRPSRHLFPFISLFRSLTPPPLPPLPSPPPPFSPPSLVSHDEVLYGNEVDHHAGEYRVPQAAVSDELGDHSGGGQRGRRRQEHTLHLFTHDNEIILSRQG